MTSEGVRQAPGQFRADSVRPPPAVARALALQRAAGNRATRRLLARVPQADIDEIPDPPPAGAAGGCGLCYAEKYKGAVGPRDAGSKVHQVVQAAMWSTHPSLIPRELYVRGKTKTGEIDLARVVPPKTLEIGEIKPADSDDVAIGDIDFYLRLVREDPRWKGYTVRPLELKCPQPLEFPTLSPDCPLQQLYVANTKGLYLYFCQPDYKTLMAAGCKCRRKRRDEEDRDRPPVIGDGVDDGRYKDLDKEKDADKGKGDEPDNRPPLYVLDGDAAEIAAGVSVAIAALALALGEIPSPLTILEALGAALGWALARLLTWLGFGIAASTLITLLEGSAGADPSRTSGTYPVPGDPNPKRPAKGVPPTVTRPPAGTGAGRSPSPKSTPRLPAPQKAGKRPSGGGGKAQAGGRLTQWATVEGLNVANAWVGQELWVVSPRDRYARGWFLVVTDKVTKEGKTTLTMQSFEEYSDGHPVPAGNTCVVTHPYQSKGAEHDPESVLLALGEPSNLPKEVHRARGMALLVSLALRMSAAAGQRQKAGP